MSRATASRKSAKKLGRAASTRFQFGMSGGAEGVGQVGVGGEAEGAEEVAGEEFLGVAVGLQAVEPGDGVEGADGRLLAHPHHLLGARTISRGIDGADADDIAPIWRSTRRYQLRPSPEQRR